MPRIPKFGVFVGCVCLLISLVFRLFIGDFASLILFLFSLLAVSLSLISIVIWLLIRPSFSKLKEVVSPLVVVVLTVVISYFATSAAWTIFLWPRQQKLTSFTQDLVSYGRITEMSDGRRYHKSLNGTVFDSSDQKLDPPNHPALLNILKTNKIELGRYIDFRKRLISLGFIDVEVHDNYVAFLYDGMLDNLYGVLWVKPGANPPAMNSLIFGCNLIYLHARGEGWYLFGTT